MIYISAKELAARWGIDPTRVHRLAREGRIEGATLFGRNWMFPADAKKPADGRTKEAKKAEPPDPAFRFPLFVNFSERDYAPPLSSEEEALREAQLSFHACRFEEARELLLPLKKAGNRYVRISALYHCLVIAQYENSSDFDSLLLRMNYELSQSFPYREDMQLIRYGFDADHVTYKSLLEDFTVDPEYVYHPSSFYVLALVSFIPIQNGDFSLMSRLRYDSQEVLCRLMERDGHFLEAQKMHYLLAVCYQLKNDTERMESHIRRGLTIAMEHELYYTAAFYGRWYPEATKKVLLSFPNDFSEKIQVFGSYIQKRQILFEESRNRETYMSSLSGREYEFAFLANQSYTNREIAVKYNISEKTVSKIFSRIYDKLGLNNRQELVELINSTHKG